MVRLKHRYFLVQILYPDSKTAQYTSSTPDLPAVVRIHQPTPDAITAHWLLREIRNELAALYGDYGAGVAGGSLNSQCPFPCPPINTRLIYLRAVKYFSSATSTFILRCARDRFRLVWASLCMMTALRIPDSGIVKGTVQPCVMRVLRVSGTIRKAEEAAISEAKRAIWRAREGGAVESRAALARLFDGEGAGKDAGGEKGRMRDGVDSDGLDDDDDDSEEDVDMDE